jgi:hypothetical protein
LILGLGVVFLFAAPVPLMNAETKTSEPTAEKVVPASQQPFGLFRGMTLAEAIRQAENKPVRAAK